MRSLSSAVSLLACTALFAACNKCHDTGPMAKCDASTACTEEFQTVTMRVSRADGRVPQIDSIETVDESGKHLQSADGRFAYSLPSKPWAEAGVHIAIVDDSWVRGNQNKQIRVVSRGWNRGVMLYEETFVIATDCCHVSMTEGPNEISLR